MFRCQRDNAKGGGIYMYVKDVYNVLNVKFCRSGKTILNT